LIDSIKEKIQPHTLNRISY